MSYSLIPTAKRMLAIGATALMSCVLNPDAFAAPGQLQLLRTAPSLEIARQLSDSVDAGDSYQTATGRRALHRLAGRVAVRVNAQADQANVLSQLTRAGGPLGNYEVEERPGKDFVILKAPDEERSAQLAAPATLGQKIASARAVAGVELANPVFIDPASGLRLIATDEIIVRLKPETDPAAYFGAARVNVKPMGGTPDHFILRVPGVTAEQLLGEVNQHAGDARAQWAEPNFLGQGLAHQVAPNDPLFPNQWGLNNTGQSGGTADADIDAPEAWATTTGNANSIVAVLDVGTQTAHPDLNPNLAVNSGETAGNAIDDDGNGYVDDVNGWDFWAGNNDPNPKVALDAHGTAVAGIAAARGNNSTGIAGGAHNGRVLPIRVAETLNAQGNISLDNARMAEAIYYAAGRTQNGLGRWRGADVLSISLGFGQSQVVDDALTWAVTHGRNEKGCPVFVSSGNGAGAWAQYGITGFPQGNFTFKWQYAKNGSVSSGDDRVWMDDVIFPGGASVGFNGTTGTALPAGWTTGGTAGWISVQNGVNGNHALEGRYGPNSRSIRSGVISHNQVSWVQVTRAVNAGDLTFWLWQSSEVNDVLQVFVNNVPQVNILGGVPALPTAVSYPASHALTIAVGASTDFDFRADYSQFGTDLDFVAPAGWGPVGLYTTDRTGTDGYATGDYFATFAGTSAACPLAASVGALLIANDPNLTAAEVRTTMRNTCDQVGGVTYTAGFNQFYGYGRVNANRALGVNNHPVVTVPGPLSIPEDTDLSITTVQIADSDVGAGNMRATLTVNSTTATLTLGTTTGVTVTGNGTRTVTVEGPLAAVNTSLASLKYRNTLDGSDTITIVANDLGNTGTGGAQTDTKTIQVTVTFVNDFPHYAPNPPTQTFPEDTMHCVEITVSDEETPADQLYLSASTWYETLIPQANITVTANGALRTICYTPAPNQFSPPGPYGAAPIFIVVTDAQGYSSGNFFLNNVVQAVNDPPAFVKGNDQVVLQGVGAQTVNGWATGITPGPNESGQTVSFQVSNDAPSLFSSQPTIAANGTLSYTPAAGVSGTATVTVQAQDDGGTDLGGVNTSASQTFTITVVPAGAWFVKTDSATQGNWKGVYGSDGYTVILDKTNNPAYAQVSVTGGDPWLWPYTTPDMQRALQKATSETDRIEACWHSPDYVTGGSFTVDISLTDGQVHQLAVYCEDWDTAGRRERIEVLDATTGSVIDTRVASSFTAGRYLIWNLRGHVQLKFINLGPINAVISGLFFDTKPAVSGNLVWVDEAVPAGASTGAEGGDSWNWITANPAPYAGQKSHQANVYSWEHQHYFQGATSNLLINPNDLFYTYVYLNPSAVPGQVMLQWNDLYYWHHRAYWGANLINYSGWGVDGTESHRSMGALPTAGQWVRLEVPAYKVGLGGRTVNGMAFTLYGGQATWDNAGKSAITDSDADGLPDAWETENFGNLSQTATGDPDNDALTNAQELRCGSNPNSQDTDSDGISDGDEVNYYGTNPGLTDSDSDGLSDNDEIQTYGSDPAVGDTDGDGLGDGDEVSYGTSPGAADSDWDGLNDYDELFIYGTDPNNWDSDSDGISDGEEVSVFGTQPTSYDTDGDSWSDGDEVYSYGTDPLDPNSHP